MCRPFAVWISEDKKHPGGGALANKIEPGLALFKLIVTIDIIGMSY
jgi:hypothetical protein